MKTLYRLVLLSICFLPGRWAIAADNPGIERLVTCQDSWLDWRTTHSTRLHQFIEGFRTDFTQKDDDDGIFVPRSSQTVLGLPITQASPESIGMAVGFSILVNADFDRTKAILQNKIGRTLKCEPSSYDARSCELTIGAKKTILLAEVGSGGNQTLLGCYYFYEK